MRSDCGFRSARTNAARSGQHSAESPESCTSSNAWQDSRDTAAAGSERCSLVDSDGAGREVGDWEDCNVAASTPNAASSSQRTQRSSRRFVLIEYVMLRGVNDTPDDAERSGLQDAAHVMSVSKCCSWCEQAMTSIRLCRLLQLLAGTEAKVNLIGFNSHAGTQFKPSITAAVLAFRSRLIVGGRVCTVRESRGDDEMAACGQLGDLAVGSTKLAPVHQPPPHLLEAMSVA